MVAYIYSAILRLPLSTKHVMFYLTFIVRTVLADGRMESHQYPYTVYAIVVCDHHERTSYMFPAYY